jgi:hypothetical protein
MKTVKNCLGGLMLVILMGGVISDLQAQGRGKGNPGRGHDKENHPGKDHDKHRDDKDDKHDRYDRDGHDSRPEYARNDRDNNYERHDYSYNDRKHAHYNYDYDRNDRYYRGRHVTYSYHRYGSPSWAPAYGYRYNTRYIYYRDYNVYYDCHRDVFLSWTGRTWIITNRVPDVICHVDFKRAVVMGVDYWNDDFDFYLTQRRPNYVQIRASW